MFEQIDVESANSSLKLELLKRVAGCILVAGVTSVPVAAQYGIEHANARDSFGQFPVNLEYSGDGQSHVSGFGATISAPLTEHGIGMSADIELPDSVGFADIVSRNFIKVYSSLFSEPQESIDGYKSLLFDDLVAKSIESWLLYAPIGSGLLFGGMEIARRHDMRKLGKKSVAVLAVAGVFGSSVVAGVNHYRWGSDGATNNKQYELPVLDDTIFNGATTDKEIVRDSITEYKPFYEKINKRQSIQNKAFIAKYEASLSSQIGLLEAPRSGESSYMLMSDTHGSKIAPQFMKLVIRSFNVVNPDALQAVINVGDLTNSSAAEISSIKEQADISDGRPTVVAPGNHDSDSNIEQMKDAGMTVTEEDIVVAGQLKIAGRIDSNVTPLFGSSKPRGKQTESSIGEQVREQIAESPVDVAALHEGYAVEDLLDINSIRDVVPDASNYRNPRVDLVPDIAAKAIAFGHWHDEVAPRVIYNSDGSWAVIFELGSASGAIDDPTPTNFSLPNAPPQKIASFIMVFRNDESGLVTGFQRVRLYPSGKVWIAKRTNIGSIDGQPYQTASD